MTAQCLKHVFLCREPMEKGIPEASPHAQKPKSVSKGARSAASMKTPIAASLLATHSTSVISD